MIKKLSLWLKIILSFLIIAAVLAGASFYQIRSVQRFGTLFLDLVDNDIVRLGALNDFMLLNSKVRDLTFEYQHEILEGATDTDTKEVAASLENYSEELKRAETHYRQLVGQDEAYVTAAELESIAEATDNVITASDDVARKTEASQNFVASEKAEIALTEAQEDLDQKLGAAMVTEKEGIDSENDQIVAVVQHVLTTIALLAFVTIALAVLLGLGLASWIARAVSRLKTAAVRIANGDFTQPITITAQDELGQLGNAFNSMSERLRDSYRRIALEQRRDEAMLQSMSEGLIALDEKGVVVMINTAATGFLGLPDEAAAIGKPVVELYQLYDANAKKDGEPLAIPLERRPSHITLTTGEVVNDVYGFRDGKGGKRLLNISSSAVKLDGKVVGAVTLLRDVTKEKEVDRMKTEFISLASHQLRTPLSAIKWYTEMLVSGDAGKLEPEQLEFAKNVAESTERMIALVNALLNISRIESGRIMIDPKPTDLKELVSGIVTDLKAKTEEKQQSLIISVHDDLPQINLDPRLVSQVYLNLLTNAIKYTPKGGEISVFISKKDGQVISQVTDNGYGIPKEQQGRLFQKFFRASNAVKVETDGTGLGLYLIKAVVESSGGKIWFESEEGKGSTFWFSMPLTGMVAKQGEVTLDI